MIYNILYRYRILCTVLMFELCWFCIYTSIQWTQDISITNSIVLMILSMDCVYKTTTTLLLYRYAKQGDKYYTVLQYLTILPHNILQYTGICNLRLVDVAIYNFISKSIHVIILMCYLLSMNGKMNAFLTVTCY